jgi:hypothetical protein
MHMLFLRMAVKAATLWKFWVLQLQWWLWHWYKRKQLICIVSSFCSLLLHAFSVSFESIYLLRSGVAWAVLPMLSVALVGYVGSIRSLYTFVILHGGWKTEFSRSAYLIWRFCYDISCLLNAISFLDIIFSLFFLLSFVLELVCMLV